jgi:hypothetical protein
MELSGLHINSTDCVVQTHSSLYRVIHLKRNPNYYTWPFHAQNDEINSNIESLQPYPVVAVDILLGIGTAVISAILSLDEHLSQTKHFLSPEILLPAGVQSCYSAPPCQDTHC